MTGRRILFVDDDAEVREALGDFFTDEGYDVQTARDGRDALARLATFPADLVVTDLEMPVMNGLDLGRSLVGPAPRCAVLLVTAHPGRDQEIRALGLECMRKPLDLHTLIATIERLIAAHVAALRILSPPLSSNAT
jgi:DNA-binding response OmpR family regulator